MEPTMRTSPGKSVWRNFSLEDAFLSGWFRWAWGVEKVRKMMALARAPTGRLM
jgi:hypothetical protein